MSPLVDISRRSLRLIYGKYFLERDRTNIAIRSSSIEAPSSPRDSRNSYQMHYCGCLGKAVTPLLSYKPTSAVAKLTPCWRCITSLLVCPPVSSPVWKRSRRLLASRNRPKFDEQFSSAIE